MVVGIGANALVGLVDPVLGDGRGRLAVVGAHLEAVLDVFCERRAAGQETGRQNACRSPSYSGENVHALLSLLPITRSFYKMPILPITLVILKIIGIMGLATSMETYLVP